MTNKNEVRNSRHEWYLQRKPGQPHCLICRQCGAVHYDGVVSHGECVWTPSEAPAETTPTDAHRLEEIRCRHYRNERLLGREIEFLLAIIDRQNAVVEAARAFDEARSTDSDESDPFETAIAYRAFKRALAALENPTP